MAILQKQVKNTEYFKFKQPIIFEYKLAVPANQDWNYQKSETNQTNRNRASGPNPIQPSSTNAVATQPWREHSLTLGTLPWLLLHDRMQCTSHWHGIMAGNFDRIGPSDTDFLITFGLILMLSGFFLKKLWTSSKLPLCCCLLWSILGYWKWLPSWRHLAALFLNSRMYSSYFD